jgi:hypothetical protein
MAIPASVIPSGNSYSVHVAGPRSLAGAPESPPLTTAAATAAALLQIHKVDVRQHLTGDDAPAQARRDFLMRAGAKASAFSPAPAPGVAGEGFWKTTLAVVEATGADFWWPPREDKKVEWEPLLVALSGMRRDARGEHSRILPDQIAAPDLWIVAAEGDGTEAVRDWIERGAGAVAVITPSGTAWASRSATFGNARGSRAFDLPAEAAGFAFGVFAGGVVAGLIVELLGENAFDKGIVRAEREELEARPLHLAKAAGIGAAAARVSAQESPARLLHKGGNLAGRVRALLQADDPNGPSKPWGNKGR